jgi:cobalt-zinc-cadmium efflux system membrane fusion protein
MDSGETNMRYPRALAGVLAAAFTAGALAACDREPEPVTEPGASAEIASAEGLCEHDVDPERCPFCNPELIEEMGMCPGHGVPEAICFPCHPDLEPAFRATGDWCAGHDRPESQCYLCNPELDPQRAGALPAGDAAGTEPGHAEPFPRGEAGRSGPDTPRHLRAPSVHCGTQDMIVRFDSPRIAGDAGLELARAERRSVTATVECNAVVDYDGDRHALLSSQVPGVVEEVHCDYGQAVRAGDPLVTLQSPRLGAAKAALLRAKAAVRLREENHVREVRLLEKGIATEVKVLEAETALAEARIALAAAKQELLSLGLTHGDVERVVEREDTASRHVVAAPFDGLVLDRPATAGEVVETAQPLCEVADLSRMWIRLDVYEADAAAVGEGQPVVVRVDGIRGETFGGQVTWVSSRLDPETRTLEARAEVDNAAGLLRANMFGEAEIAVRSRHEAVVVPEAAVQWEGCCNVVFVRRSDELYEPRKVRLGVATGTVYEVLAGLQEGEEIVTQGSFLLKTELTKGSIGAGCCEVHPGT